MTPLAALQARQVSVCLGGTQVLREISVDFPRACWSSIVGPNGAGKSTLLKALAGLSACGGGTVMLLGQLLHQLPARQRAQQLAWLGQNEVAAESLQVYHVVMLGRLPRQGWLAAPSPADHAAVQNALQSTHAWEWRNRSLGQLSGGERQRVLLARALAVQAEVLLMDEPLASLDPPHQSDWLVLVKALAKRGKTVVSVLHELTFALQADEVVVMNQGGITHQGRCADPASHRAIEAVFDQRIAIHPLGGQWVAMPRL